MNIIFDSQGYRGFMFSVAYWQAYGHAWMVIGAQVGREYAGAHSDGLAPERHLDLLSPTEAASLLPALCADVILLPTQAMPATPSPRYHRLSSTVSDLTNKVRTVTVQLAEFVGTRRRHSGRIQVARGTSASALPAPRYASACKSIPLQIFVQAAPKA